MNTLFIIGNGFDMAHQLNTGYNDFRKFIIDTCKEFGSKFDFNNVINRIELEGFKNLTIPKVDKDSKRSFKDGRYNGYNYHEGNLEAYEFFFTLTEYANHDKNVDNITWNEFEKNLAKIPFKEILKDNNICLTKLNDLVWAYKLCQNAVFFDWIYSKIQNPEKIKVKSKLIDSYSKTAFYLVFNYTTLLERKYNINNNRICNIHGQVTNSDQKGTENNLVVGFKSEVPLILQTILHNSLLIKPVRKLLKENIDFFNSLSTLEEIYNFGLNIVPSDIPDIPYLKEIIKHTDSNTKFYVNDYYLTEQNKNDIQNNLKNWGYNGVVQFINMM